MHMWECKYDTNLISAFLETFDFGIWAATYKEDTKKIPKYEQSYYCMLKSVAFIIGFCCHAN